MVKYLATGIIQSKGKLKFRQVPFEAEEIKNSGDLEYLKDYAKGLIKKEVEKEASVIVSRHQITLWVENAFGCWTEK